MICTRCQGIHADPHHRTCETRRDKNRARRQLNQRGIYPQRDGTVIIRLTDDNMMAFGNAILMTQNERTRHS